MGRSRNIHFEITRAAQRTIGGQTRNLGGYIGYRDGLRNRFSVRLLFAAEQRCSGTRLELLPSSKKMRPPAKIIHLFPRSWHGQQFRGVDGWADMNLNLIASLV